VELGELSNPDTRNDSNNCVICRKHKKCYVFLEITMLQLFFMEVGGEEILNSL
jgi:hypothetical protein